MCFTKIIRIMYGLPAVFWRRVKTVYSASQLLDELMKIGIHKTHKLIMPFPDAALRRSGEKKRTFNESIAKIFKLKSEYLLTNFI